MGSPPATNPFDRPVADTTHSGSSRLAALDVTRAVALVGVVVMNYHGYLNGGSGGDDAVDRLFDIDSGILSTRFAAVFVLVAGVAVSLMTARAVSSADHAAIRHERFRLVRRGLVLVVGGAALEHAWPGTILFYYGLYFVLASMIITLRSRLVLVIAASCALGTTVLHTWEAVRIEHGHDTSWLHPAHPGDAREFLLRSFYDHTHPVLPWFAFLCLGIVIGRSFERFASEARRVLSVSVTIVVGLYGVSSILDSGTARRNAVVHAVTSMRPFTGGLFYVASTAAIAVAALAVIVLLCERPHIASALATLQRAGQMTLSLYLLHVIVFYATVRWTQVVDPGLGNALLLGLSFWVIALALGSWWHHRIGRGPAERLYRRLGG